MNVTDRHLAVKHVFERDCTASGRLHAVYIGCRTQHRCGTGATRGTTRRQMRPEIGAGAGVKEKYFLDLSSCREKCSTGNGRQVGGNGSKVSLPESKEAMMILVRIHAVVVSAVLGQ